MRILYTCLFGQYDDLREPLRVPKGWNLVCFTNQKDLKSSNWDIEYTEGDSDKLLSRKPKILNPFKEAEVTVYQDATFQLQNRDLNILVNSKLRGIHLNKHPRAVCAYQEAQTVIQKKLDKEEVVQEQINRYRLEGFPENAGLWRCGIMIRNPKDTEELNQIWWNEVSNYSWRDQVSFPYACWKSGVTPQAILPGVTTSYFKQYLHKPKPTTEVIHHFQPVEGVNKLIQKVSKNDWIVVGSGEIPKPKDIHLFVKDNFLMFPRWLHDYIQIDFSNKRRWDLQFKHIVEVYSGQIEII